MLILSIATLDLLIPPDVDAIEVRCDLLSIEDLALLPNFLKQLCLPTILTLRIEEQGGRFKGSQEDRIALWKQLLSYKSAYVDLEYDSPDALLRLVNPCQLILSYHNHNKIPEDLKMILTKMHCISAAFYKIALHVHSATEALELLLLKRKYPRASFIAMGTRGAFSRVLGPVVGNDLNYTILQQTTAPGQIPVQELIDIYHYSTINRTTELFGLIGSPVDASYGHIYHNKIFYEQRRNALYVKMEVTKEELPSFLPCAVAWGFQGLSVTMPLKEAILPFLQDIDPDAQEKGAVNTVLIHQGELRGFNTDGKGALDAIEKRLKVQAKQLLIIGSGGAAKALAHESQKRGAFVCILSKDVSRAASIGRPFSQDIVPDIVINCSPHPLFDFSLCSSSTLVMDCVYNPQNTPFLQKAIQRGLQVIFGEEMFYNQADEQQRIWTSLKQQIPLSI